MNTAKQNITVTKEALNQVEKYMKHMAAEGTIIISTDGSSRTNHQKACANSKAGWAAVIARKDNDSNVSVDIVCGSIKGVQATNQRAELVAIYEGLQTVTKAEAEEMNIVVQTDSQYSINCYEKWINNWKQKGWVNSQKKPVQHRDIIEPTHDLVRELFVDFEKVKAHSGELLNEIADAFARSAA